MKTGTIGMVGIAHLQWFTDVFKNKADVSSTQNISGVWYRQRM